MKNYYAQTPQNLELTIILQNFRKISTPQCEYFYMVLYFSFWPPVPVPFPCGVNTPFKGVLWYSMCEMVIWAEQYYGVWYNNH